jgi:hypothetical protein
LRRGLRARNLGRERSYAKEKNNRDQEVAAASATDIVGVFAPLNYYV